MDLMQTLMHSLPVFIHYARFRLENNLSEKRQGLVLRTELGF